MVQWSELLSRCYLEWKMRKVTDAGHTIVECLAESDGDAARLRTRLSPSDLDERDAQSVLR